MSSAKAIKLATQAQKRAARPGISAWVSANAGSGKTRVLVDRVMRLLLSGAQPSRILCLTYTNAAAAEMASRLYEQLAKWATLPEDKLRAEIAALPEMEGEAGSEQTGRARHLFARALETPGGLKIQTIHAFCEHLLHRFPMEAGVSPGFEILDERERGELLGNAQRRVLSRAALEPDSPLGKAFRKLASLVHEMQLEELISKITAHDWLRQQPELDDDLYEELARSWDIGGISDELDIIEDIAGDGFLGGEYERARKVLVKGKSTDIKRSEAIRLLLETGDAAHRFDLLKLVFLRKDGEPLKSIITKDLGLDNPVVKTFLEEQKGLVNQACKQLNATTILAATRALVLLGRDILADYENAKRVMGRLDYDDLIRSVNNLISRADDAQWVLFKLDGGIDHVLIDEAQDTSPEQWDIVAGLTAEFFAGEGARDIERTVFAVGDEKQSIYSFQGADPDKFGEMREWFGKRAGERWKGVPLEVSFRSSPVILEAVDRVFAQPEAGKGLSFEETAISHEAGRASPGLVEIWPLVKYEPGDEDQPFPDPVDKPAPSKPELRLAAQIAAQISEWIEKERILTAKNRPVRPGDILILVRKRGIFADAMVRALKRRNIAVAGADRMELSEQLGVQDLMALGDFTLQPDDDLNLAALLKSPLVGIDEDELFDIAWGRKTSLWTALGRKQPEIHQRLSGWARQAQTKRPYEFFSHVLDAQGCRKALLTRLGFEANDPIDEFLVQALNYEQSHAPSLQGFLAWLKSGKTEIKRDMEHGRNEVRVMTVHGAKGLEANIVFLPDTCSSPDSRNAPPLLDISVSKSVLPVWPVRKQMAGELMEDAYDKIAAKQREEYNRLLYVAMTRARDELYLCGFEGKQKRASGCWYDLVRDGLENLTDEMQDGDGQTLCWRFEKDGAIEDDSKAPERPDDTVSPKLPEWALSPATPESAAPKLLAPSRLAPLHGDNAGRFRRGRLIHSLLEFLPEIEPDGRRERAIAYLMRPGNDLDEAGAGAIADEVMAIIEDEQFAAIFGPDSMAEAPFGAVSGIGASMFGQIDRMVITEREILILDYKTNRPAPDKAENVPLIYLRQMAAYRDALITMFPEKPVRAAILWTDGPRLMELPPDLLEPHKLAS